MRTVVAAGVAAMGAAVGALILGEYTFAGWQPVLMGPLAGLALAEVVVAAAGRRNGTIAALAMVAALCALLGAGAISVRGRSEPLPPGAVVAAALAAVAAWIRAGGRSGGSRSARHR